MMPKIDIVCTLKLRCKTLKFRQFSTVDRTHIVRGQQHSRNVVVEACT